MDDNPPMVPLERLLEHRAWVREVARALVLDESRAADHEQEVWLEALRRPPRADRSLRGWLATALRHNAADAGRAERRRGARERRAARPEAGPDAADLVAEADAHQRLVRAVLDLEEPYRGTLLLRYFEDLGPPEVAARQGVPVETVRTRLRRGLERLRARFDAESGGDRRAWCVLLLPLARRARDEGAPAAGVAAAAAAAGGILMAGKGWAATAAAALLLLAAGAAWLATGEEEAPSSRGPLETGAAAAAPAAPGSRPAPPQGGEAEVPEAAPAPGRATIEARVTDGSGEAVPGAVVEILASHAPPDDAHAMLGPDLVLAAPPPPLARLAADAFGVARLEGVAPGRHPVQAAAASGVSPAEAVTVAAGEAAVVHLVLGEASTLEGRLLGAGGAPVAGARVALSSSGSGVPAWSGATDAEGRFAVARAPVGPCWAIALLPGGTIRTAGRVVLPVEGEREFRLEGAAAVRVTVLDDAGGAPVPGAAVQVLVMDPAAGGLARATGAADADGVFLARGLPTAGGISVSVAAPGYLPFDSGRDAPHLFAAAAAARAPAEGTVRLRRGAAVEGRVLDDAGAPVAGARVHAAWRATAARLHTVHRTATAVSGPDGAYRVEGVPVGAAYLVAEAPGHAPSGRSVREALEAAARGAAAHADGLVTVAAEGTTRHDLVLPREASVVGVVVDGAGLPVPGAEVSVPPPPEPTGNPRGDVAVPTAWTGPDGSFRLGGLPPGEVRLAARRIADGLRGTSEPLRVVAGGRVTGVRLAVAAGAVLAGSIVDAEGLPVPRAHLRAADRVVPDDAGLASEVILRNIEAVAVRHAVRPDGTFRVTGLAGGPRTLFAGAPGYASARGLRVDLADGEAREDLRIVLVPERAIAGRVLDEAGVPLAGATVAFRPEASTHLGAARGDEPATTTDAGGRFRSTGLPEGRYEVRAKAPGRPDAVQFATTGGGDLEFRLAEGLDIAGIVVDASGGAPLGGVQILLEAERAPSLHDLLRGSTVTDADGRFAFDGLAAGSYRVVAGGGDGSPFIAAARAGVAAGTRDLRIEVERGAAISGRVLDPSGRTPTTHVSVYATPEQPGTSPGRYPTTTMRPDGSFRIEGVRPGRHRVTASPAMGPGSTGLLGQAAEGVEAGASGVELRLVQGALVRLRIVREDGSAPGARSQVRMRPAGRSPLDRTQDQSGIAGPDGRFESWPVDPSVAFDVVVTGIPGFLGGRAGGVRAGDGETTVTLERGGRIEGRLVDAGEGGPAAGVAILAQAEGTSLTEPGATAFARSGEDGAFALEGLGSFPFTLKTVPGSDWLPVAVEGIHRPGATVEIRVRRGARLEGRLLDAAGRPAPGANLRATPESRPDAAVGVRTGDDGGFTLKGLPPGRVAVSVHREDARGRETDAAALGTVEIPGPPVELRIPVR